MKKRSLFLVLAPVIALLAGCTGTPVVYYSDCTCSNGSFTAAETAPVISDGVVKTGLAIVPALETADAAEDTEGSVSFDVTQVAVLVDEGGVIVDCAIDGIGETVSFDITGAITSDAPAGVRTKNEKGDDYGMVAWGGAAAEWYQQAEALARYAVGKTVEEMRAGAVGETGYAQDADLASSATIYLGGYVSAIEAAVANAEHLGARTGDELVLASVNSLAADTPALDCDAVALTVRDGVITSCRLDALQAKTSVDENGAAVVANDRTRRELGYDYGMVTHAGAAYEWFEQADSFAAYVTGMTAEEVMGIAVTEGKAADADLASSVTISIGGFQTLIAKAMG